MTVRDLWKRKDDTRTPRYGHGQRWQVNYTDPEGRRVSRTFDTREEAELFDAGVKIGKANGTLIPKSKEDITFDDLWDTWLETKSTVSAVTLKNYKSLWRTHIQPTWGRRRVCEAQEHQIAAWAAGLTTTKGVKAGEAPKPVGAATKRKAAVVLSAMLKHAVRIKIIHSSPLDKPVIAAPAESERRFLTIEEVDTLLRVAPTQEARNLVHVLLKTALRPGEAKGLKVKDLDPVRRRLRVQRDVDDLGRVDATKSRKSRDVPVSASTVDLLEELAAGRKPEDFLLLDEYGHVWTTARWRRIWHNMLEWGNLDRTLTTYELRHTAISMAIAAGADVYTVQLMAGHADVATTLRWYGHRWDSKLDLVAEAIDKHLDRERLRIAEERRQRAGDELAPRRHLRLVQ